MISFDRSLITKPTKLLDNEYKKRIYLDLYDKDGNVKPRWNSIRENNIRVVRDYLINITKGCCTYCGKKIKDSDMDVDHFLPSHEYNYLAYCLDNLVPSCKKCNQNYKNKFVPNEIKGKKIIEACMEQELEEFDYIYDKDIILNELCSESRLIEPTFDNVEEHVNFNPEFYMYEAKTKIGENTISMFFDKSEFVGELEEISNMVKEIVEKNRDDNYEIIEFLIRAQGYDFYYNKFYEYWQNEKVNNRL
ncbi:HNH endonuclease signature motif containing protein [Clostridium sp.]|uniref:HNH endonuclease n=1 Tax=Clostridium sp. TaxID=1506 RepID=UPI0032168562